MSRCAVRRAAPFTTAGSGRAPAVSTIRPVQQRAVAVKAASSLADEYADVVDIPVSGGALPMASDKARLRIRMRSYEIGLLADCVSQIQAVAETTGAVVRGPVMLPTKKKVFCVLRSPHVDKDAREHFEVRTHHRLVDLQNLSAETVAAMMQWIPPSGVEVECSIA